MIGRADLERGRFDCGVGDGVVELLELAVVTDPLGDDDVDDGFVLTLDVTGFADLLLDTLNVRHDPVVLGQSLFSLIDISISLLPNSNLKSNFS